MCQKSESENDWFWNAERNARKEGYEASTKGLYKSMNPYNETFMKSFHLAWNTGWDSARIDWEPR